MAKIEWDKPGARRYEIGVDHGVLYPGDSEGVPWNGLVSVDEDASGAEQESLYFDGYKYYDYVSNEEFQATLSAFTYPDEFEACLGRVMVSPGAYASGQPRKTFGLAWRTKIADDLDGDRGYKLHILYNATALPSSKSYQTHAETPAPVNFQWQITAVPVLPGESLVNQGVDPNDWVWPEGYGMPGWPVGPDGNTPVPGWRGFPYVIIDSTDPTVDPVALDTLNTHLNGTDLTPPYLPDPVALNQILNGVDVPYDYKFDWTNPNPPVDNGPFFYWQANDYLIQRYSLSTGELKTLTNSDPRIPQAYQGASMGGPIRLGSGNLFIRVDIVGDNQAGFVVDSDLNPTGETWEHLYNSYFYASGYVLYDADDGIFDPVTGVNWLADTVADHPWEWNGFDNAGHFVKGRGDAALIPDNGGSYLGGNFGSTISASMLDRWLYRNGPDSDIITRYNLDTDVWEAIYPEWQDPADTGQGFGCWLLGVDDLEGIVTLNTQNANRSNYDGKQGWIQVRDPNADPWINPVPDGPTSTSMAMGRPLRQYDPAGPGGPAAVNSLLNNNGRYCLVRDGKIYYNSATVPTDYNTDADGMGTGVITSIYALSLSDGSIVKVCDIAYHHYDAEGNVSTQANSVTDSYINGGLRNLIYYDPSVVEASKNINFTSPVTWNTSDYDAKTWAVPQTVYGSTDAYSAITDASDDSYIKNIRSLLDTSHGGSAGTDFKAQIVASGGTVAQIDGMTLTFRVRANSDIGLTQIPLNFYLSDTLMYVVNGGQVACDGAWHDITATVTKQGLVDKTANANADQVLFDEMKASGTTLDVYIDSAWAESIGAAAPWNVWLDFSKIEVHGA